MVFFTQTEINESKGVFKTNYHYLKQTSFSFLQIYIDELNANNKRN